MDNLDNTCFCDGSNAGHPMHTPQGPCAFTARSIKVQCEYCGDMAQHHRGIHGPCCKCGECPPLPEPPRQILSLYICQDRVCNMETFGLVLSRLTPGGGKGGRSASIEAQFTVSLCRRDMESLCAVLDVPMPTVGNSVLVSHLADLTGRK